MHCLRCKCNPGSPVVKSVLFGITPYLTLFRGGEGGRGGSLIILVRVSEIVFLPPPTQQSDTVRWDAPNVLQMVKKDEQMASRRKLLVPFEETLGTGPSSDPLF